MSLPYQLETDSYYSSLIAIQDVRNNNRVRRKLKHKQTCQWITMAGLWLMEREKNHFHNNLSFMVDFTENPSLLFRYLPNLPTVLFVLTAREFKQIFSSFHKLLFNLSKDHTQKSINTKETLYQLMVIRIINCRWWYYMVSSKLGA